MGEREATVDDAIARASRVLWDSQREDGSWDDRSDVGPSSTANVLVALAHANLLDDSDRAAGARWLLARQRPDGSFAPYPFAPHGALSVTAQCAAALSIGGERTAADRAMRWVDAHGGVDGLLDEMRRGDVGAVFVALAGLLPPERLPCPPLVWCLSDTVVDAMAERFHFGIVIGALQLSLVAKRLRDEPLSWLERRAARRAVDLMTLYQNADGSWNSNTVQTAIAVPALLAAGLSPDDPRVTRAERWLESRRVEDADGVWFDVFSSDVWSTAFGARALVLAGTPANDPRVVRAVEWLLDRQLQTPQPLPNNRRPGALRTGGWPFQTGNETMADCDDAGIVLSALGVCADAGLPAPLRPRVHQAVRHARHWLRDMQNPDGGWAAFVWNLPGHRPPGTLFDPPPDLPPDDPVAAIRAFLRPPAELGDPSTEDLTARVLHGLASFGAGADAPEVAAGLRFLQETQTAPGCWWGRWVCNYLPSTAYVLSALARVGVDPSQPWVARAIDWTCGRQNEDGGFGEGTESYLDLDAAGVGPSTPACTGLVVSALVDVGLHDTPTARRAVDYLLARQEANGTWPNDSYLATNIPPSGFYAYAGAVRQVPLEALARFRRQLSPSSEAGSRAESAAV